MMIIERTLAPIAPGRPVRITGGAVVRVAVAVALACLIAIPALAAPTLRPAVEASGDVLTLGDLLDGAPAALAGTPVFRAPAAGETGTIQAGRIIEAARRHGVADVESGGHAQILVRRAGRRVDLAEIETAVRKALELRHQIDARHVSVVLDGPAPALGGSDTGAVHADDLSFDPRTRRFSARVALGGGRAAQVSGHAVDMVEIPVLTRSLGRGETVQASDVAIERRPKSAAPADALTDAGPLAGQVARRALASGAALRAGDLQKPEIVARNEAVTIVYEIPGMTLTLRGRANEAGAKGDVIAVTNPQSKRVLQATVLAPGKVAVFAATPGPIAARP